MKKLLAVEKKVTFILGYIFLFELILGFTGTMITIRGEAIRHIIFIPLFLLLYLFCLLYMIDNKIPLFKDNGEKKSILHSLKRMDWCMLAFIVWTFICYQFIPSMAGVPQQYARAEILDALATLIMYFPLRFMVEWKELRMEKISDFIFWLIFGLCLLHVYLYFGQKDDMNFMTNFFASVKKLLFNSSQLPDIKLGHGGYTRVIFSVSVYIIVEFYLVMKRLDRMKWYDWAAWFVALFALFATMTKSMWFGFFAGAAVYVTGLVIDGVRKHEYKLIRRMAVAVVTSLIFVTVMDHLVFSNMVYRRLHNAFATEEAEDTGDYYDDLENEGSVLSNKIKIEQTGHLLKKWMERPITGNGYGSYSDVYVRDESRPFTYEMQLPALLMKTGIIGVLLLLILVWEICMAAIRGKKDDPIRHYAWWCLMISFMLTVQTNPLLLSFTGISIVIYMMLESFETADRVKLLK